jgi:hypothetical protein
MTELALPEIQSLGVPPTRHASRVVSEMLKVLARRHAQRFGIIEEIAGNPHARDGCKKAQRRLEQKLKNVGHVGTCLRPGKRGVYNLRVFAWIGWDPIRNEIITADDPLPPKPWLAHFCYEIAGLGKCQTRYCGYTVLFLTHHALQRCTERWAVRDLATMERVIDTLADVSLTQIGKMQDEKGVGWHRTLPEGIRVPLPNGAATLVLTGHETLPALVLVTILDKQIRE